MDRLSYRGYDRLVAGRRRQRALRFGIPALVIAGLTLVALWRVGAPRPTTPAGARPAQKPAPLPALTEVVEVRAPTAVGRRVQLENVAVAGVPSPRTIWIGGTDDRVFVVFDPDVKRSHEARVTEGGRVTLIGLVRAAPPADVAVRQWSVDAATARLVEQVGTYLYVTEVRAAS